MSRLHKISILIAILSFVMISTVFSVSLCRCVPGEVCWPSNKDWEQLQKSLSGKLVALSEKQSSSEKNPFVIQSSPSGAMSQGWLNAWQYRNSTYVAEVKNAKDIQNTVNFARKHNLRLVIKGAGHDYLGRSSAPNSLLIWTGHMRGVNYNAAFVPQGCRHKVKPQKAIIVDAGARWIETYRMAAKHNRYVQGGGCTTVGAAGGFIQGGGFGSFSKKFGSGAAGVLQAQVVTPDGKLLTANECQNRALFWALKGGGGSTYGVVTRMTLLTHPLPKYYALIHGDIVAKTNKAFKELIEQTLAFYDSHLNNAHWGEQITFNHNNSVSLGLVYVGQNKNQVEKILAHYKQWIDNQPKKYHENISIFSIPPKKLFSYAFWHKHFPAFVVKNTAKDARPGEYWWASNGAEVGRFWYTYQSWWLPRKLFNHSKRKSLTRAIYLASRDSNVSLHINKGLSGASKDALDREVKTSINPVVNNAAALLLMSAGDDQMNKYKGKILADKISKDMKRFRELAPNSGTYDNEADYFQKNWQTVFWGDNYAKLLKIKKIYDPTGLLYCHHCVGSEEWSKGGMCKK